MKRRTLRPTEAVIWPRWPCATWWLTLALVTTPKTSLVTPWLSTKTSPSTTFPPLSRPFFADMLHQDKYDALGSAIVSLSTPTLLLVSGLWGSTFWFVSSFCRCLILSESLPTSTPCTVLVNFPKDLPVFAPFMVGFVCRKRILFFQCGVLVCENYSIHAYLMRQVVPTCSTSPLRRLSTMKKANLPVLPQKEKPPRLKLLGSSLLPCIYWPILNVQVIADPTYFEDKCEKKGEVVRAICILNHPVVGTDNADSAQIIIPQKQVCCRLI